MSFIPRVEGWIDDLKRRMKGVPEGTAYHRTLSNQLREYEELLGRLREIAEGKQRSLPIREPGE